MKIAVLSTGDEVLSGQTADTNAAWLSDFILGHGFEPVLHLAVGDDLERIMAACDLARQNADAVLVTGGLGPTADDLTTEAVCRLTGRGTVQNERALRMMQERFRLIGREMSPSNRKQALLPEGAELLENPIGTAGGYHLEMKGVHYFFMPGVPGEMTRMMEQQVLPILTALRGRSRAVRRRVFRTFGLTESRLGEILSAVPLPPGVKLGYRAVFPEIQVKLVAWADRAELAEQALAQVAPLFREKVGPFIYSEDDRSLAAVVGDLLRRAKLKLAVAESCTGGWVAKMLTDVPGSSDYFERGYVTYSNAAKVELLGVPADLIERQGAVSSEVARAMAEGARSKAKVDVALAVTGIAGPAGGSPDKPVGLVQIALADAGGTFAQQFRFPRPERELVRELAAYTALDLLRRRLEQ
jgi:nicotinamide-nucleotide amidase